MAFQGPASLVSLFSLTSRVLTGLFIIIVAGGLVFVASPSNADIAFDKKSSKRAHVSASKALSKRKIGASSDFGVRRDPINKRREFHKGIDISRPKGTKVLAWSGGTVVKAGQMGDYGQTVDILHPNGLKTRYAHLLSIKVHEGQKTSPGQILGQVGRSGRTTGANLHFEVMEGDRQLNPVDYLSSVNRVVGSR